MTKIKMNDAVVGHGNPTRSGEQHFSFAPGQIVDIEDELANAWVESGLASRVIFSKIAEKAVAKKPETPEAPKVEAKADEK